MKLLTKQRWSPLSTNNLADYLPEGAIIVGAFVEGWQDAVLLAGEALVAQGAVTNAYPQQMVQAVEDLGPYIVVAPGFALAHARPSSSVLKAAISWVNLATPVEFGNQANDPVRLVVGLAAPDHDSHIDLMSALAAVLAEPDVLDAAIRADTPAHVREVLASAASPNS